MTIKGRPRTVEEALPVYETAAVAQPAPVDGTPRLPPGRRLSLAIIDGPDAGKVFRIEKPKVVIGRSGADLVLNDDEASRHHAALEVRDTVVVLQDLGSTNGTLVDGNRINGQTEITNQSEFQVGSSTLMLIITEDEPPPAR
jgi:pSer/pThr/pTyr-binding forkhead associated (FHA) protein